jgi:hypothetical protein
MMSKGENYREPAALAAWLDRAVSRRDVKLERTNST